MSEAPPRHGMGRRRLAEALDAADLEILRVLQADASLSAVQLAERVNMPAQACWRRLGRLRAGGYIAREVAILDPAKFGLGVSVYVRLTLGPEGRVGAAELEAKLRGLPEVSECCAVIGDCDLLLKVWARDLEAYEDFLRNRLSVLGGLQAVVSTPVVREVKRAAGLPI